MQQLVKSSLIINLPSLFTKDVLNNNIDTFQNPSLTLIEDITLSELFGLLVTSIYQIAIY